MPLADQVRPSLPPDFRPNVEIGINKLERLIWFLCDLVVSLSGPVPLHLENHRIFFFFIRLNLGLSNHDGDPTQQGA